MCLNTVDAKTKKGTGVGYKVFVSDKWYHLSFQYCGGRINYDEWYKDKAEGNLYCFPGYGYYRKGYHIFTTLEGAKKWAGRSMYRPIRKVEYRAVAASGTQQEHPVVVAREIYIHKGRVN